MSNIGTDPFILIRGGLVDNDPALPHYNLEVLDDDLPDDAEKIEEIRDLIKDLGAHAGNPAADDAIAELTARLRHIERDAHADN